ncbi:MAG: DUF305 domain-containing protein [Actinomycetota bacterium]
MENAAHDDETILPWWQSKLNLLLAAAVVAMLAAGVGWWAGRSGSELAHNDVDTGFLHDMRIHHEQAVAMSMTYLEASADGGDEVMRLIAREIMIHQGMETGRMVQLLRVFGEPEESAPDQVMGWMGMPVDLADMPGYASDSDLERLQAARGAAADRVFADLMIAHHEGGIHMAEHARDNGVNGEVDKMARSMIEAQRGEIAELNKLAGR